MVNSTALPSPQSLPQVVAASQPTQNKEVMNEQNAVVQTKFKDKNKLDPDEQKGKQGSHNEEDNSEKEVQEQEQLLQPISVVENVVSAQEFAADKEDKIAECEKQKRIQSSAYRKK